MLKFYVKAQNLWTNEKGQDTVEYAVLIAIIATAVAALNPDLTATLTKAFTSVQAQIK